MKTEDFKKLLKNEEPQKILKDYMYRDLSLSDKQLGIVIELKNKKATLSEVLKKLEKRKKYVKSNCISRKISK